jgi:hypothetical protein
MDKRGSALAYRRQEAYRRLAAIDAGRLRSSGFGLEFIAGRADTTRTFVRQWLEETAPATPTPQTSTDDDYEAGHRSSLELTSTTRRSEPQRT